MANLKVLKTRITSVKSTQKITKAMQMVAASKLRRAQENAEAARPYTEKMERMLTTLASSISLDNAPELLTGHISAEGKVADKNHLIVVATSDRGLCGGFNSTIVREVRRQIEELESKHKSVILIIVGKKGYEQLRFGYEDYIKDRVDTSGKTVIEYADAEDISNRVITLFSKGKIDKCSIIYNKFVTVLTQKVTLQPLIPLEIKELDDGAEASISYEYEPGEEEILSKLLPLNIAVQVYHALLENSASEQGARMTAMDSATRNAGEMIDKLTLVYNRTRQAAITTELTEIISGAEAL